MRAVRELVWAERMSPLISEERLREDFIVAVDGAAAGGGAVVGCGGLRRAGEVVEVTSLVVARSHRGRGIGSAILLGLIDAAADACSGGSYSELRGVG